VEDRLSLRLGLLKCDPRPVEAMYAAWLPDAGWTVYDVFSGQLPASPSECDGWVGTGSRFSVYDDEAWIRNYAQLVRDLHAAQAPFAGVCFSHQMLGHALGGRTAKSPNGWCTGVHQFDVWETADWMVPPLARFGLVMSCQDQVLEPPPGTRVLAGNDQCPAGMIQIGSMLGMQGHPEFTPEYGESLMLARREVIGEERVRAAQATLRDPRHAAEVGGWVRNFFRVHSGQEMDRK